MVHVVFAEVIFREVRNVRLLDVWYVGRMHQSDVHLRFWTVQEYNEIVEGVLKIFNFM